MTTNLTTRQVIYSWQFLKTGVLLLFSIFSNLIYGQDCIEKSFGNDFGGIEYLSTISKNVYVNVHFIRDENGQRNFDEINGKTFAQNIIDNLNYLYANNVEVTNSIGQASRVIDTKIQFEIKTQIGDSADPDQDGIYFWNSEGNWARLRNPAETNNVFGSDLRFYPDRMNSFEKDSVVNVFFLERYQDWYNVIDTSQASGIAEGIGSGNSCVIYGAYHGFLENPDVLTTGIGNLSKPLAHEFGHLFGLNHSMSDHGISDSENWCGEDVTNNFMKHSCNQRAFTATQIFLMHRIIENKDYVQNQTFEFPFFQLSDDIS
ncbi:MAG: hypothetical protein MRY83_21350, partial [Flavobacteriales bacterium]|nr:hypothetical protein [Flavobacteriales bacterium]